MHQCFEGLQVVQRVLNSVVAIYVGHTKSVWQGERVDGGSERGISAVDEIIKIAGYSSFESVHHYLHLLLHRLHLCEDGGWSHIHKGWDAYVSLLQLAWGVTSF